MSLLNHAIDVLNCFDEGGRELRLSDISRRLGISSSHTHRLLTVLVDGGLLRRAVGSPRYRLGMRLFELGRLAVTDFELSLAFPTLQALTERTGETTLLAVRERSDIVFVERVDSPNALRVSPPLNRRYPARIAAGQALVAWERDSEVEFVIRSLVPPADPRAAALANEVRESLAEVRRLGYAVTEQSRGIRAVAAPVRDEAGRVVAAVSVAAPIHRLPRRQVLTTAPLVMAAALDLSEQLAGSPPLVRHQPHPAQNPLAVPTPVRVDHASTMSTGRPSMSASPQAARA